ncbi:MAG: coproporphyrinogen oxidase, anaerobic [Geobacteraceae bacterium]|nr:coproporphyrinogen oxidase, anaerobic [Geobacteraceae bacterium]
MDDYAASLVREMRLCRKSLDVPLSAVTMFFGGGTPSLMDPVPLQKIIDEAAALFGLCSDAEITIEANPGTLTMEKLSGYRSCGANRLSLGVQSFNDSMLEKLGRVHTAGQAYEAFRSARKIGFANMGIDLINSLPGQTLPMWEDDLLAAVDLAPEHISVYGLTIEEGTPFAAMEENGTLSLPGEEESAVMYERASRVLGMSGYEHYEISNYARTGFRSRHNQVYWRRGNYLGFGAGAHSFMNQPGFGERWHNTPDLSTYMRDCGEGRLSWLEKHGVSLREAMAERLFLGLRMLDGVDLGAFRDEFGVSFEGAYPRQSSIMLGGGLLEICGARLKLSARGLLISNQVFMDFL